MHHPTDGIAHTTAFVTPVVEHWLEREIVLAVAFSNVLKVFIVVQEKKIIKKKRKESYFNLRKLSKIYYL